MRNHTLPSTVYSTLPVGFMRLPIATQVIYIRIKQLVDKFAFINCRTGVIRCTTKDNPDKKKFIDAGKASKIFHELYGE